MKKVLVTGSLAYDNLMTFNGLFADHFLADQLDKLSVSFLTSRRETHFGGCGGNIAFSLKIMGFEPLLLGVGGNDFQMYSDWLVANEIAADNVIIDPNHPTACANILSDKSGCQIAMFSPSAMEEFEGEIRLKNEVDGIDYAILGPQIPKNMVALGKYFGELGVKYLFDPGQALVSLSKEEILGLLSGANGLIFNGYEAELLQQKIGQGVESLLKEVDFVVQTMGENGAKVYFEDQVVEVAALRDVEVVDATGCGDAFRGGFVASLLEGGSYQEALRFGNLVASFCLGKVGTQTYKFTREELMSRYEQNYV